MDWRNGELDQLARRIAGAQRAADLAQEARLARLKRPPTGDERAWFVAVLKNLARQTCRGEGRRSRREHVAARPEAVPPDLSLEVREAVAALPEPYRTTIVMRYFDGLSSVEIAEREKAPASTVRNRLHRALKILRAALALPLLWIVRPRPAATAVVITLASVAYAEASEAAPAPVPAPMRRVVPRPGPERTPDRAPESRPVERRPRSADPSL